MFGYHVSIEKKSYTKSIQNAHNTSNINAIQIFLASPLQIKIIEHSEDDVLACKKYVNENNIFLISHASYLLNSANKDKWEHKINVAISDLIYAEKIGAIGSVFHVGKHLTKTVKEGTKYMFEFISTVIEKLQERNSKSIYILETPAACGTELLSDIESFGKFYHSFSKKQQTNLKVCIDTCHVFSAGYSLKSKNDSMIFIKLIENHIGWNNIAVIHLNDSKKDCGCHVDRHENLCYGCIGQNDQSGLEYFVKFCFDKNIPLIMETPDEFDKYHNKELIQIRKWIQ